MNIDVEELLRDGMERFTAGVRAPAGLAHAAASGMWTAFASRASYPFAFSHRTLGWYCAGFSLPCVRSSQIGTFWSRATLSAGTASLISTRRSARIASSRFSSSTRA